MSRHELTPRREHPGIEVALGWDPPLATYFAIVSRTDDAAVEDDHDPVLLWIGTAYGEIDDAAIIVDAVRPYTETPEGLADILQDDLSREGTRPRSPWII